MVRYCCRDRSGKARSTLGFGFGFGFGFDVDVDVDVDEGIGAAVIHTEQHSPPSNSRTSWPG
ncbi:hypothetical protein [Streptomyces europaeiscabiei]|uniref:hypothetical protein n=1 Tax=Streptomyces europaeiscabiei TaxID=146819 RepID=UPI0029AB6866|nr:hypothetical protein [Streptomyces europaeiscabiei]MDX2767114.1 hypothetical protein [Streptomyces europaeiscabiei]